MIAESELERPKVRSHSDLMGEITLKLITCDGKFLILSEEAGQMAITRGIGTREINFRVLVPEPSGVSKTECCAPIVDVKLKLSINGKRLQRVLLEVAQDRLIRETR